MLSVMWSQGWQLLSYMIDALLPCRPFRPPVHALVHSIAVNTPLTI